jgi:RNA polymerase sigma factor (sigma-70 family)
MSLAHTIERARQGDAAARQEVSDLLRERVLRTAGHYASLTGMDREDLQQEMWLGMLIGLQQVDVTIGDPLYYLFLRGKWRLLEAIRRSERERADSLDSGAPIADHRVFEDDVCSRWLAGTLASRLRDPQRAILKGLLQGHMQEELARSLGCSAANISYHVRKIREGYRALAAEGQGLARSGVNVDTPVPGAPGRRSPA